MAIVRVNKNKDYVTMSNYHFKEKEMSLKAKGLLSEMLSLPDDWDYSIAGLAAINKENETSIKSTLDELRKFGYLKITKLLPNETKTGRIEYVYDIYEQKQEGEKQGVENLGVEFLGLENQGQYNINNKINKNKEIDNNKLLSTKKRFVPPTLEEVKSYCEEKNFDIDYKAFYDYYNVSNWKDSEGKQVKNWKQKMITWATRRKNNNSTSKQIIPDWFGKEIKEDDGEWEFSEEDKRRFGLL